jgi:hypothetical protein
MHSKKGCDNKVDAKVDTLRGTTGRYEWGEYSKFLAELQYRIAGYLNSAVARVWGGVFHLA